MFATIVFDYWPYLVIAVLLGVMAGWNVAGPRES